MIWNVSGLAAEMLSGVLVMPLLIHRLGDASYGVWVVLGSMTSYFGLLDLGLRGSIGRFVALYSSKADTVGVNQTVCGGLLLLSTAAAIISISGSILSPLFFRLFEVPPENHELVDTTIWIVLLQLSVYLIGTAFDAVLWGLQRFDATNLVDIPAAFLRLSLSYALIWNETDLPKVAFITLGISIFVLVSKAFLCFRCYGSLELRFKLLERGSIRELLGFGSWNLLSSLAKVTRRQLPPLMIGSLMGLASVAPFSIADRILTAMLAVLSATTGVMTPYAANLHAKGEIDLQKRLFLRGGYLNSAIASCLVVFLCVFSEPLITAWVGSSYDGATILIIIMLTGEFLGMTQFITAGILQATARHRLSAIGGAVETILVFTLATVLIPKYGIIGAAYAIAIPAFLSRGVLFFWQGCAVTNASVITYVVKSVLLPTSASVACGVLTVLMLYLIAGSNRFLIGFCGIIYFVLCGLSFMMLENLPTRPSRAQSF